MRTLTTLTSTLLALALSAAATRAADDPAAKVPRQRPAVSAEKPRSANSGPASALPAAAAPVLPGALPTQTPARPIGALHWDTTRGDHTVWVRGASFKARFDGRGLAYSPFLGSDAPATRVVRFDLESAELGGAPLALEPGRVSRSGAVVTIDRGALREVYRVALDGIEQTFELDTLPRRGELVLSLAVTTDLAPESGPDGTAYRAAEGHVRFGRATAFEASGASAAAPVEATDGGLRIRVPAGFVRTAAEPLVVDPWISTVAVGTPVFVGNWVPRACSDVAANVDVVVTVEQFSATDHDVFIQHLGGTGAYVDFTTEDWGKADVANNAIASQFFVVSQRDSIQGPSGYYGGDAIVGRSVDAATLAVGPVVTVATDAGGLVFNPSIGGDPHPLPPTYYCVTWMREFNATDHDVHAQLVDVQGNLAGPVILVENSSADDFWPVVSESDGPLPASQQTWNVVWTRGGSGVGIWGAQVSWDGLVTAAPFPIHDVAGETYQLPAPSAPLDDGSAAGIGPRSWLVAYTEFPAGDSRHRGALVRGSLVQERADLTQLAGGSAQSQGWSEVSTDDCRFVVTYRDFDPNDVTTHQLSNVFLLALEAAGGKLALSEGPVDFFPLSTEWEWYTPIHRSVQAGAGARFIGVDHDSFAVAVTTYELPPTPTCIDAAFCSGQTNSSGFGAALRALGSTTLADGQFQLDCSGLPPNKVGYFLTSRSTATIPIGQGILCLGAPVLRFSVAPLFSGAAGAVAYEPDLSSLPQGQQVLPGETWYWQYWFRDLNPTATTNFSDGVAVTFQ